MEIIETIRLRLRRLTLEDAYDFYQLNADPMVMRYFPGTLTREVSDSFLTKIIDYYQSHPDGWLAAEANGAFIGFIGTSEIGYETPFTPATEVGWRLIPSAWGKGYATEGARVCLHAAFARGLDQVVAMTTVQNKPSQRVMQRLAMRYDPADDFDHPMLPANSPLLRHVLYRINREEWLASGAG